MGISGYVLNVVYYFLIRNRKFGFLQAEDFNARMILS